MCVFARSPGAINAGQDLTCDGMETFLGEGEIANVSLVSWTHESITFVMPPGVGTREVTVRAGAQPPIISYSNWQYATPRLTMLTPLSPKGLKCVPHARLHAALPAPAQYTHNPLPPGSLPRPYSQCQWRDDGAALRLLSAQAVLQHVGPHIPHAAATASKHADAHTGAVSRECARCGRCRWPSAPVRYPLAAPHAPISLTQWLVIQFDRTCISNALDATNRLPTELEALNCRYTPMVQSDTQITFAVPPGIGKNKSVTVNIWENKAPLLSSAPVYIAYAPPMVTVSAHARRQAPPQCSHAALHRVPCAQP